MFESSHWYLEVVIRNGCSCIGHCFQDHVQWIHHGLLKIKVSDLPDKGIRRKRQSDGRRRDFAHGHSVKKRPKAVQLRQEFGHFELDTMQSTKVRGDVLVTITERLGQQHIVRHVNGRNSQAVTPDIIRFFKGIKNAKPITVDHGR